jgi:hypothetical protein
VRVTFLGRDVEDRPWTLGAPAGDVVPAFVDHRDTDGPAKIVERVRETRPDVVVALRPRALDGAALRAETGALALAVADDELDTHFGRDVWTVDRPPVGEPPDRPVGYDRVLTTDPQLARAWGAWRSAPLPVDDAFFVGPPAGESPSGRFSRGNRPLGRSPYDMRLLFLGESTAWRERFLIESKHHYDLSHYAFGLAGEELREVLENTNIGVLVRRDDGITTFPRTAPLHLAAGHLLFTELLRPPRGLEAGLDHVEVHQPDQLLHHLHQVRKRPGAFEHVRIRGRRRAEAFRGSIAWPRLLRDLVADVGAFGRPQ